MLILGDYLMIGEFVCVYWIDDFVVFDGEMIFELDVEWLLLVMCN